jgi:hypothetical protein
MEARNAIISKILDEAEVQVAKKIEADKNFYKELLKKLIIQVIILSGVSTYLVFY